MKNNPPGVDFEEKNMKRQTTRLEWTSKKKI
jgi:hypothetical protein